MQNAEGVRGASKKATDGNRVSHPAACSTPDRRAGGGRLTVYGGGGGNPTRERRGPSILTAAVRAKAVADNGQLPPTGAVTVAASREEQEEQVRRLPSLPPVSKIRPQRIGSWTSSRGAKEKTLPDRVAPNCPHCRHGVRNQDITGSAPAPPPILPPCYHHHAPYFPWLPPPYPPYPCFSHHPLQSSGGDHTPMTYHLHQEPPGSGRRTGERNRLRNKSDLRNMDALDLASVHYWPPPPRMLPADYYYWYLGGHGLQPPYNQPASDHQMSTSRNTQPQHRSAPVSTQANRRNLTEDGLKFPLVAKSRAAAAGSQHQSQSTDQESVSTSVANLKLSQPARNHHTSSFPLQNLTSDSQHLPKKSLPVETMPGRAPAVKSRSESGTSRGGAMSGRAVPAPRLEEVSDMQDLQVILADLMTCCEENIRNIRADTSKIFCLNIIQCLFF